jgi:peptidyl-prolyl cis-trans isomerase SurA
MSKRTGIKDEHVMLDDMIDRKLQMAEAKKTGLDVTDKELGDAISDIMKRNNMEQRQFEDALAKEGLTLEQYRTEFREQMTISRLFNKYVRTGLAVDEAEARSYFEKNREKYTLPEEIRVRMLAIEVPDKAPPARVAEAKERAAGLLARLRAGEDFVTLIRENSSGPTAAQDGDLGFFQRAHALPEIAEAAKDLKPGDYAGPVRTADGFQIIRLEEVRQPVMPFEKVKEEITKTLFEQKMENSYRAWLQTLRTESHIENRL